MGDGTAQTITIDSDCDTVANCATALTALLTGATVAATSDGNNMVITSASTGSTSSVAITADGSGTNAQALFASTTPAGGLDSVCTAADCAAGYHTYDANAGTCSPCMSITPADTVGYTECPVGSTSDTATMAGTCDFKGLMDLLPAAFGGGGGDVTTNEAKTLILQCRTVYRAMGTMNLQLAGECGSN